MSTMNRLGNCHNKYQGDFKKVLCVCSAGLLRSPTTALVLSKDPFNYNTRCAGIDNEFTLVLVDDVLLEWCDEIVCMDKRQEHLLRDKEKNKTIINLNIPDKYEYRHPELIRLIEKGYNDSLLIRGVSGINP